MDIKRIVLTGGPCGGKTSALNVIVNHFSAKGYKVFTVPEMATIFTAGGMNYVTDNAEFFRVGERETLRMQLAFEEVFANLSVTQETPCLIVCDRGALDISAYCSPEIWETTMSDNNVDTSSLLSRYDIIIHLVTTADGAEQFYTTGNNVHRYEKADEEGLRTARMLDKRAIDAWKSHPNHHIIRNDGGFEHKLQQVIDAIELLLSDKQV